MFDGLDPRASSGAGLRRVGRPDRSSALRVAAYVEPIGWHGFPTPRRRPVNWSVATGHPPPEVQIASQVRSATGMTFGRASHDGAKMHHAFAHGVRPEPAQAAVSASKKGAK